MSPKYLRLNIILAATALALLVFMPTYQAAALDTQHVLADQVQNELTGLPRGHDGMASQESTIVGAPNAEEWRENERRIKMVAAKATSKYLFVCIYNNTAASIPYTWTWEGYRCCRESTLQPYHSWCHWYPGKNYPLDRRFFYIKFYADFEGHQLKSYKCEPVFTESSNIRDWSITHYFGSISSHEFDLYRRQ